MPFQNHPTRTETFAPSCACLALLALAAGCSDSTNEARRPPAEHVYALQTTVYQPDDSVLSYVALTDTLDVKGKLSLRDAREFAGYSFMTAIGNKLLVSSGEAPEITQFEISAERTWNELTTVSFANLGVPDFGAGLASLAPQVTTKSLPSSSTATGGYGSST